MHLVREHPARAQFRKRWRSEVQRRLKRFRSGDELSHRAIQRRLFGSEGAAPSLLGSYRAARQEIQVLEKSAAPSVVAKREHVRQSPSRPVMCKANATVFGRALPVVGVELHGHHADELAHRRDVLRQLDERSIEVDLPVVDHEEVRWSRCRAEGRLAVGRLERRVELCEPLVEPDRRVRKVERDISVNELVLDRLDQVAGTRVLIEHDVRFWVHELPLSNEVAARVGVPDIPVVLLPREQGDPRLSPGCDSDGNAICSRAARKASNFSSARVAPSSGRSLCRMK